MTWLWIAVITIAFVVEIATTALVSVWFIAGAVCALIANLLGVNNIVQYGIFFIASLATLVACRPIIMKNRSLSSESSTITNVDANIGKDAVVTETINNILGTGRVNLGGDYWAAKSIDDTVITDGVVTVVRVEGAKVIVKLKEVGNKTDTETVN